MTFHWPAMLLGLVALPLLYLAYRAGIRGRAREAVVHSDVVTLAQAAASGSRVRQHAPATLVGLAVASAIVALARPVAPLPVPSNQTTVMLSIDVSRSMLAQDLPPNRIEAAKQAAREFVLALPRGARVGLVTFSSYATLLVSPTTDRGQVLDAIDSLTTEFATAIGDGLLEAVWALPGRKRPDDRLARPLPPASKVPPGSVVLLSDGQSNRGVLPTEAAEIAREQQVKVYTVGIGTPEGAFLNLGGRSIWVRLDEETLRAMAEITGARYYSATSTGELRRIYRSLARSIGWETKPTEVSAMAAAASAVLLAGAVVLSLVWVNRIG